MKNKVKIAWSCLAIAFTMASCKIDEPEKITIVKPLSVADKEFLNAYDALKTYVDRSANPNFILSAGTSLSDFTDKGLMYRLLSSNFDQVTPNSGMLHGNIVEENGAYNFGNMPAFLSLAKDAGISVFGNSLVWHAQQAAAFLNDLLKDETTSEWILIPGESDYGEKLVNGDFKEDAWNTSFRVQNGNTTGALTADGQGPNGQGRALMVVNPAVQSAGWGSQMIINWNTPMLEGEEWTFKMDYKSDAACEYGNQAQSEPGAYMHNDLLPKVTSSSEWKSMEETFVVQARSNNCKAIAFDLGLTATTYYFANLSLYKHPTIEEIEMLENGDFSDDVWNTSFRANGSVTGALTDNGQGSGGKGRALMITNADVQTDGWRSQMIIVWDTPMLEGETWKFRMDYKSDAACTYGNQAQSSPGAYMHGGIIPNISSNSTWQTLETEFTVKKESENCKAIAFDLGLTATTYYFDNISLIKVQIGGPQDRYEEIVTVIPKTEEQKVEIITGELERWIAGIMDVAGGNIKDWTVVNQPMDDNNPSQLRPSPDAPAADEFYWQKYLGKDYARLAVEFARKYGGANLKLFVNETGLLNSAKCKGLTDMIAYWEQDGTTKIDGIDAQISLTCSLDATTQKSNEDELTDMLNSLKETGKLIRISGLDMQLVNANGSLIGTTNVTREQQLAMSKFYNFVIRKYFEIIPAAQRYGITMDPIESASNAGLWDRGYSRKFTFSGVADGLAGKATSAE